MRRRLGRLDGGGKSSWRRLGALFCTGVSLRACRGAGRRLRGVEEGMWASSVVVVRRPEAGGALSGAATDYKLANGWPSGG